MRTATLSKITSLAYQLWEQRWAFGIFMLATGAIALTTIVRNSELLPAEAAVTRWLHDNTDGFIHALASVLDVALGNATAPPLFVALTLVVWRAWGRYATLLFLAMGGLTVVTNVAELAFRPRPDESFAWREVYIGSNSFPSGHVIYAVLVLGTLAYLAHRHMSPSWRRATITSILAAIVVVMGVMRVIELDHWPADVTASYLISLPLLLTGIWLYAHLLPWLGIHVPRVYALLAPGKRQDYNGRG